MPSFSTSRLSLSPTVASSTSCPTLPYGFRRQSSPGTTTTSSVSSPRRRVSEKLKGLFRRNSSPGWRTPRAASERSITPTIPSTCPPSPTSSTTLSSADSLDLLRTPPARPWRPEGEVLFFPEDYQYSPVALFPQPKRAYPAISPAWLERSRNRDFDTDSIVDPELDSLATWTSPKRESQSSEGGLSVPISRSHTLHSAFSSVTSVATSSLPPTQSQQHQFEDDAASSIWGTDEADYLTFEDETVAASSLDVPVSEAEWLAPTSRLLQLPSSSFPSSPTMTRSPTLGALELDGQLDVRMAHAVDGLLVAEKLRAAVAIDELVG